jgi:hypothetical protein
MGQLIAGMTGQLVAVMSGVPYTCQNAQATGNGDTMAIPPSFRNHTFIITAATGVTSGAVQIESSNSPLDANTWGLAVAAPTTVSAGVDIIIQLTGIFNFLRARISTTIAGGSAPSVTVVYEGAKSY